MEKIKYNEELKNSSFHNKSTSYIKVSSDLFKKIIDTKKISEVEKLFYIYCISMSQINHNYHRDMSFASSSKVIGTKLCCSKTKILQMQKNLEHIGCIKILRTKNIFQQNQRNIIIPNLDDDVFENISQCTENNNKEKIDHQNKKGASVIFNYNFLIDTLSSDSISNFQKLLLLHIYQYSEAKFKKSRIHHCVFSYQELAVKFDKSESSISKSITILENLGLIKRKRFYNKKGNKIEDRKDKSLWEFSLTNHQYLHLNRQEKYYTNIECNNPDNENYLPHNKNKNYKDNRLSIEESKKLEEKNNNCYEENKYKNDKEKFHGSKPLFNLLEKKEQIHIAMSKKGIEITEEQLMQTIKYVTNKYNLKFRHLNQVVEYIQKTFTSHKNKQIAYTKEHQHIENWETQKNINDIQVTEEQIQLINKKIKRNFNLISANKVLDKIKLKYPDRTFKTYDFFVSYITKVFQNEMYCETFLSKTHEQKLFDDRVEKIRIKPAKNDEQSIIKNLSFVLNPTQLCNLIDTSRIEYIRKSNTCYIKINKENSHIEHDNDIKNALIKVITQIFTNENPNIIYQFNQDITTNSSTKNCKKNDQDVDIIMQMKTHHGYEENEQKSEEIKNDIKLSLNDEKEFQAWFEDLVFLFNDENRDLRICTTSKLVHAFMLSKYRDLIYTVMYDHFGDDFNISVFNADDNTKNLSKDIFIIRSSCSYDF